MSIASLITTWKVRDVVPVPDQFPTSLLVLVVDDDPTCLIFLEKMLRNCSYDVFKITALSKLRENRNGFDIITSNVYMPNMDRFKLLEHIGLDIDMPIIMMSVNDWKRGCYERKLEKLEKSKDNKDETEDKDDTSTLKTPRVVWSVELHQQFVASVNQLGIDSMILLPISVYFPKTGETPLCFYTMLFSLGFECQIQLCLKYVGLPHEDAREHLKSFLLICASFSEKGCNIPK
ncbi:hypothetical protein ES332_D11G251300v1 [Gossypium tomentosum]|uniref:Response regulatory domain-containing protein n=1 Tax=Gossypium tomentosum TaxID=34277 RepID=A0A5D2IRP3_GOSTO|nr:hypothetical protein ES332_D11G251300v1 [Gossypium tomentosum]